MVYMITDGYETTDMILLWMKKDAVEINEELQLPQFDLIEVQEMNCTKTYSTGKKKCQITIFVIGGNSNEIQ